MAFDDQNPGGPQDPSGVVHYDFTTELDNDPTLLQDIDQTFGGHPQVSDGAPKPGLVSRLWSSVKRNAKMAVTHPIDYLKDSFTGGMKEGWQTGRSITDNTERAIARGVLKAGDQASDAVVSAAIGIDKKTGLYKLGRDEQEEEAFLKWWEQPTAQANPLRLGDERIKRWIGGNAGGMYGFVESAAQFTTGLLATTKYLKFLGAEGAVAGAGKGAKWLYNAGKAAATDMTFFDPYQERISNWVQSGPEAIRNPLTKFLASDKNDPEALARLKQGMEGFLLGSTIDATLALVKAGRARLKGNPEEFKAAIEEAANAHGQTHPEDVVGIRETADGKFEVHPLEMPKADLEAPAVPEDATPIDDLLNGAKTETPKEVPAATAVETATFHTRAEAENIAATINLVNRERTRVVRGIPADENFVKAWQEGLQRYMKDGDVRSFADLLDTYGLNLRYTGDETPEGIFHALKALVDLAPEPTTIARGKVKTWAETAAGAQGLLNYFGNLSRDQVTERMAALWGHSTRLDEYQAALKVYLEQQATYAWKLSQLATANADNGVAVDELGKVLDHLEEVQAYFTGQKSNIARAQNAAKMPTGEAFAELVERGEKELGLNLRDAETAHAGHFEGHPQAEQLTTLQSKIAEAKRELEKLRQRPEAPVAGKNGKKTEPRIPEEGKAPKEKAGKAPKTTDTYHIGIDDYQAAKRADEIESLLDALEGKEPARAKNLKEQVQGKAENSSKIVEKGQNAPELDAATTERAQAAKEAQKPKGNPIERLANLVDRAEQKLQAELEKGPKEPKAKLTDEQKAAKREQDWQDGKVDPVQDFLRRDKAEKANAAEKIPGGPSHEVPAGPQQLPSNAPQLTAIPQDGLHRAPAARKAFAGMTRQEILAYTRQIFSGGPGNAAEVLAMMRSPRTRPPAGINAKTWGDYVTGYRMWAMLSGPRTWMQNAASNAFVLFNRPLEHLMSYDPALRQAGRDMLTGMWGHYADSWAMAKRAFATGDNVLDFRHSIMDESTQGVFRGTEWKDMTWLQKIYNAPGRVLMGTDEFFKQMNYRMNVRAQSLRQARAEGITDAAKLAERLDEDLRMSFDPEGGGVNPLGLQYARISTFTNDLVGPTEQWLLDGQRKSPIVRFLMPFVRTPANIFRYSFERLPGLGFVAKSMREDFAAGGERRAMAIAKQQFGASVVGTGLLLAESGLIQGRGPQDAELRQQMIDAGVLHPYSVKIGNRWIPFRPAEPVFSALGIIADLHHISGEMEDETVGEAAAAMMLSVAQNVTSKAFMQGVTTFMDAMTSGRVDVAEQFMASSVGSFVPSVLRQMNPDDSFRETRSLVDEVMNRIPGFSRSLEPRRNMFGEKVLTPPTGYEFNRINPFTVSRPDQQGDVANELMKLGRAFKMPAETLADGKINLTDRSAYAQGAKNPTQSPYDRMLQLMAHPVGDLPPLREKLSELVQSDAWKNLSSGDTYEKGGTRYMVANQVVAAYQSMAYAQVLKEYPALVDALKAHGVRQAQSLSGNPISTTSQMFNP